MKAIIATVTFWVDEDTEFNEIDRLVMRLGESLTMGDYGPDNDEIVKVDENVSTGWREDITGQ